MKLPMIANAANGIKTALKNGFALEKLIFVTLATIAALVGSTLSVWFVIEAKFVTTAVHAAANEKQNHAASCNQAKNNEAFLNIALNRTNMELARIAYEADRRKGGLSTLERQRKTQLEQDVARMIAETTVMSKEVLEQCRLT